MIIVSHLKFDEDEADLFKRIGSASILSSTSDDDPNALTLVRRALQGDVFTYEHLDDFVTALDTAVTRREENVSYFREINKPDLAEASEQWLPDLERALGCVVTAREYLAHCNA